MKRLLLVLVVLGLLAAGTAYWISSGTNGAENGYSFESVKYGSMTDVINATGIVKPREVALVFPRLPGIVEEIYGRVGQKVAKGDPLYKLNSDMAQRSLEKARAAVKKAVGLRESAKEGVDHLKLIADRGYPQPKEKELEAQAKYHAAVEGVEEAESARKQAQLAMDWTMVRAPIAGTIIEKNLYIGQPVGLSAGVGSGGSSGGAAAAAAASGGASSGPSLSSLFGMTEPKIPFMIAADLGDMEVYAQITQSDIGRVKAGLKAKFPVDAFTDEPPFEGEVTDVQMMPVNVLGTNFFPAVIKVANRRVQEPGQKPGQQGDWLLRPGMTVNVDITRDIHPNVWKLPNSAIIQMDEQLITTDAKKKLATRQSLKNPDDWVVVWIMDNDKKPWPIFARIGGKDKEEKPGIKEASYSEVLEWDPKPGVPWDLKPEKESYPELIIATPPPKLSIFERGTPFKIS